MRDGQPAAPSAFPSENDDHAATPGEVVIVCDIPDLAGGCCNVTIPFRVAGWAFADDGIDTVVARIDDASPLATRYGQPRSDVAAALRRPRAADSGFTSLIDETVCAPGRHRLSFVAVARSGATASVSGEILVEAGTSAAGQAVSDDVRQADPTPQQRLDNGGERYVPEVHGGTSVEAEHWARYLWAAPTAAGRDVLDAACGVGWGSLLLLAAGARSVTGVDIDEGALASARGRARGAEFVRGDLLSLPFADASFDLVVSFESIEHVDDPALAIDEFRRVLRPGGMLLVSSPNRDVYPSGNPFHLRELTSPELETMLAARFAKIAMYRQQTHYASMISDDRVFERAEPRVALSASVHKTVGGRPGAELYAVAAATDGVLPDPEDIVVLANPVLIKHFAERLAFLEDQAVREQAAAALARVEAVAAANLHADTRALVAHLERRLTESETHRALLATELEDSRRRLGDSDRWLADHRGSISWRITAPLRAAKRAASRHPKRR
jgi:SAM-dependent methyltransferase